jgi:preprotein translocase subunit SecD
MKKNNVKFLVILALAVICGSIALPARLTFTIPYLNRQVTIGSPSFQIPTASGPKQIFFEFKKGLDIQGGMQIVLEAQMNDIPEKDKATALESVREVITRRVDLYGIAESGVRTAVGNGSHRLIIELPGVSNPDEALSLVGQTAKLEFQLITPLTQEGSEQPIGQFGATGIDGSKLKRAAVQFDPQTGEPVVGIQFTAEGADLFGKVTEQNQGALLGIVLDNALLMAPRINEPIYGGSAVITGQFTIEEAKQLSIQLNAGALPVPIKVLEQRTVGASLGLESVSQSVKAGLIGLSLVILFMVSLYGFAGVLASFALALYALLTIALYKILGITLTVPGIAGLILSIGMALDANILIFERMKEEVRLGKPFETALELGFGRAWDSIKDANITTIVTALVLINPLNFSFLNSSGLVRGFGITLLIGVTLGLFTGIFVTRTLLRLFLSGPKRVVESKRV